MYFFKLLRVSWGICSEIDFKAVKTHSAQRKNRAAFGVPTKQQSAQQSHEAASVCASTPTSPTLPTFDCFNWKKIKLIKRKNTTGVCQSRQCLCRPFGFKAIKVFHKDS